MSTLSETSQSNLGWIYPSTPFGIDTEGVSGLQSGIARLISGQAYIDVVFGLAQPDGNWIFTGCGISNTADVSPLNILPGLLSSKTASGFRLQLSALPDSSNYFLNWEIKGSATGGDAPTTYLLSGPSSGKIGVASSFLVELPPGTVLEEPMVITPSSGGGGGSFSPASVTLTPLISSAVFTYTPASYGAKTISATNNKGLTDPAPVSFTSTAATYTFSGPSSGATGEASTDFTVALPIGAVVVGTVTVTPNDGGDGGTFTPTSVALTTGSPSDTFTYTPASNGAKTLSVTNDSGLTNPGNLTYTAVGVALLDTLVSYWKLDEAAGVTKNDSQGANNLAETGGSPGSFAAIINNGVYANGAGGAPYLSHASNSDLQVTSDFTFSLWARVDSPSTNNVILSKNDAGFSAPDYICTHHPTDGLTFAAGGQTAKVGSAATAFTWYHIVGWYDSSDGKVRLRINDTTTYVSSSTATLTQGTDPFAILAGSYGNVNWNGLVDEVGFWKRVLTSAEITALYNGGSGLPYSSFTN